MAAPIQGQPHTLGQQDNLELNHKGHLLLMRVISKPQRATGDIAFDFCPLLFLFLITRGCAVSWAVGRPWSSLEAQMHICPQITQMNVTCAPADVVSQIREPEWNSDSDLGFKESCNLPQSSGHYGRATWKIKCRDVSQNVRVLFEAE
jgi:hypothetical protein